MSGKERRVDGSHLSVDRGDLGMLCHFERGGLPRERDDGDSRVGTEMIEGYY